MNIKTKGLELSEAEIKASCEAYLYTLMNMDKLIYLRLNSGDLIIGEGKAKRRVRCCPKGTSDGVVMSSKGKNVFVEYKRQGAKQTREQRAFELKVEGMKFEYWIVKDAQAFFEAIKEIV